MSEETAVHINRMQTHDKIATGVLTVIALSIFALLAAIIVYILISGADKAFDPAFLTGRPQQFQAGGGIGPELFNSFYLLLLTLVISTPLSMGAAVFLAEYAPDNMATRVIKTAIEVLSSLPSIVVGLFGFLFFVLMMGWGSPSFRGLWR